MFANMRSYVAAREGVEGWHRVLNALAPADRQIVATTVAVGWYPTPVFIRLLLTINEVIGHGSPAFWADFARVGAETDLTVFHRMFLRMANPAFVCEKVGDYWSRFHTHGHWESKRVEQGYVGTLSDFEGHPIYCTLLVPYMARLLELVGAKQPVVTHPECVHRGAVDCRFTARWQ